MKFVIVLNLISNKLNILLVETNFQKIKKLKKVNKY